MEPERAESPYSVVWLWEFRARDGRVLRKGDYLARPYASAGDIAAERMALLVAKQVGEDRRWEAVRRLEPMAGMTVRVWPDGDPDGWAEAKADDWIRAARLAAVQSGARVQRSRDPQRR